MRETEVRINPILNTLEGVNELRSQGPAQFDKMDGLYPQEVGMHARIGGKELIEKFDDPLMTIHQLYTAFGYSARLNQGDGIVYDPEDPPDFEFKVPVIDYPVGCPPKKRISNNLKRQNFDPKTDFLHFRYVWNKCDGSDFDGRTALVQCSIAGVPTFNGTIKQAIVGYFADGEVLEFSHLGLPILEQAQDSPRGFESVVLNIKSLKDLNPNPSAGIFAKISLKGYFFSYISQGQVDVQFNPQDRKNKGTYAKTPDLTDFAFKKCVALKRKKWKAQIVTQTTTPILTTGDPICNIYIFTHPTNEKKNVFYIDQ